MSSIWKPEGSNKICRDFLHFPHVNTNFDLGDLIRVWWLLKPDNWVNFGNLVDLFKDDLKKTKSAHKWIGLRIGLSSSKFSIFGPQWPFYFPVEMAENKSNIGQRVGTRRKRWEIKVLFLEKAVFFPKIYRLLIHQLNIVVILEALVGY